MINHEDMLLRTVQAAEACNLTEFLPMDVFAWYGQRKLQEEAREQREQTGAESFMASYLKR